MPDARGDVLCPTCGQWTPPAPFCTECGAALQGDVRDAVGEQGSDVFRRGREVEQPGTPWSAPGERFEPEPEDEAARAAAAAKARAPGGPPVDHFTEPEPEPEAAPLPPAPAPPWPAEPGLAAGQALPAEEPGADATRSTDRPTAPPAAFAGGAAAGGAAAGGAAAGAAAVGGASAAGRRRGRTAAAPVEQSAPPPPPPPVVPPPSSPPPAPRTYAAAQSDGGVSGLVFVLFLGLGILALLGGAILGGVFDGGPTAGGSPSPTASVTESEAPTPEPTPEPTPGPSVAPIATPSSSGPIEFPDGFIARAETCDEQPSSSTCDNSGAVNDGELWILVSFRHALPTDVIGVEIRDIGGDLEGEESLELNFCGDSTDCAGYTFFGFDNLAPGSYNVRATRNGTLAATTSFTVE